MPPSSRGELAPINFYGYSASAPRKRESPIEPPASGWMKTILALRLWKIGGQGAEVKG